MIECNQNMIKNRIPLLCPKCEEKIFLIQSQPKIDGLLFRQWHCCRNCQFVEQVNDFKRRVLTVWWVVNQFSIYQFVHLEHLVKITNLINCQKVESINLNYWTRKFSPYPIKYAIIAATPPIMRVNKPDLIFDFLTIFPLIIPTMKNADITNIIE